MKFHFISDLRWNSHRGHTKVLGICRGRGVWESNPPGAAPSDPPAVLKTVRPTGAPTPPWMWVYCDIRVDSCQAWLYVMSELLDALYIYFRQIFYH